MNRPQHTYRQLAGAAATLLALVACTSTPMRPPTGPTTAPTPTNPPAGPVRPGEPTPNPATPGGAKVEPPSLGWFSSIKVPDGQEPAMRLAAKGVQIFLCEPRGDGFGWTFRQPDAELRDDTGQVVARHGANYTFEHNDGSRLLAKINAYDSASSSTAVPWLLLSARSFGDGQLAGVTYVQRVNTAGGIPPSSCTPNQKNQVLRVDFSADFVFYKPR